MQGLDHVGQYNVGSKWDRSFLEDAWEVALGEAQEV